jgi:hypothetical protein
MKALNDQNGSVLAQIAPILDEAIQELGPDDRDAILLRFFERRNLRSVGEALGTNENVAQKRISRAVQELGLLLQRRGVALSAAALASGLAAGAVTAAPAGLASSIAATAFAGSGSAASPGLAPAKVAGMAKLKVGIVGSLLVAGLVTTTYLRHQSTAKLPAGSRVVEPQPDQPESTIRPSPTPSAPAIARFAPKVPLDEAQLEAPQTTAPRAEAVGQTTSPSTPVPEQIHPGSSALPTQRFLGRSGSRVRIEGTSNIHDWQVEGSIIGGFLDVGPGFPAAPGQTLQPGPVQAEAEAFVAVRSLRSVDKDGRPYSDAMDQLMYESLRAQQNPRINYHLLALSLTGRTNLNDGLKYEFESRGELVVAASRTRSPCRSPSSRWVAADSSSPVKLRSS